MDPQEVFLEIIESDDFLAESVKEKIADGVTRDTAQDRSNRRDERVIRPAPRAVRSENRHQEKVRRNREKDGLGVCDQRQDPFGLFRLSVSDKPVLELRFVEVVFKLHLGIGSRWRKC